MNQSYDHLSQLESFASRVHMLPPADILRLDPSEKTLVVSDRRIWGILTSTSAHPEIRQALAALDHDQVLLLESGEEHKDWPQVEAILQRALAMGLARDGRILGLGGGVVCDMVGFAASSYLRGCRLTLVPTTALSMVDAAFGGKTGINFGGLKNMVGSFYPAQEVRIVPELCQSLSEGDYLCGLAETIKHGLLAGGSLWQTITGQRQAILARDPVVIRELFWDSVMVKVGVVEQDLREKSIRAHLNLGHTFAHGLESVGGLGTWSHGAAVAWGMVKALQLSARLGLCSAEWALEVRSLIEDYGYVTFIPGLDPQAMFQAMSMDKKKHQGLVRFVLQRGLADTLTQAVDTQAVMAVLALD